MRVSKKLFGFMAAPALFIAALALPINAAIPPDYTGKPFCCDTLLGKPQQIPGIVKAVFFDSGGEGVGFHDAAGNQGGSMRLKNGQQIQADLAVDMQSYSGNDWDVVGYGTSGQHDSSVTAAHQTWHLSWIDASGPTSVGDWEKFTVHVNAAGTYSIDFKMAEAYDPPNLQLLTFYNGTAVRVDSIKNLPKCITPQGCPEVWHAWTLMANVDTITLDTGLQVVKLAFVTGSWNFDWMRFTLKSGSSIMEPVNVRHAGGSMNLKTVISRNLISVSYDAVSPAVAKINITDCAGRSVFRTLDNCGSVGRRSTALSVQNLRHGVYFLQLEQNGTKAISSFVFK
jgi:hypothetical protein